MPGVGDRRITPMQWLCVTAVAFSAAGGSHLVGMVDGFTAGGCVPAVGFAQGVATRAGKAAFVERVGRCGKGKICGLTLLSEAKGKAVESGEEGGENEGNAEVAKKTSKKGEEGKGNGSILGFSSGASEGGPPTNALMRRMWEIQKLKQERDAKKSLEEEAEKDMVAPQSSTPTKAPPAGKGQRGRSPTGDADDTIIDDLAELRAVTDTLLVSHAVLDQDSSIESTLQGIRSIKSKIFAKTANSKPVRPSRQDLGEGLDSEMRGIIAKAVDLLHEHGGELDHLSFGKMWKKKYPDMDLKPVIKRRIRGPGTVARLLTMSHRIVMNDAFSDGRSWPGVRVYALRESAPPRRRCEAPGPHSPDCEAVLTAASFSQVEHAKTEDERLAEILQGESLNQAIARVYAELVDETMRLNKVIERVKTVISDNRHEE